MKDKSRQALKEKKGNPIDYVAMEIVKLNASIRKLEVKLQKVSRKLDLMEEQNSVASHFSKIDQSLTMLGQFLYTALADRSTANPELATLIDGIQRVLIRHNNDMFGSNL